MPMLFDDVRFAWRALARNRGLTAAATLVAGLGLGIFTAFFGVVNGVLYRPLPYRDADELIRIGQVGERSRGPGDAVSPGAVQLLREASTTLVGVAAFRRETASLLTGTEPVRVQVARTTPDLFAVLGVGAALGRTLTTGDDDAVLLAHDLWVGGFGADSTVLGQSVRIDGERHVVVGIMPADFGLDRGVSLYLPLDLTREASSGGSGTPWYSVIARRMPRASMATVRAELATLSDRLPATNDEPAHLQAYAEVVPRDTFFRGLEWVLLGAAGLLLLVTCSNVAGLLLARGARRRPEIAVRAALGGSRRRIFRQSLLESALLAGTAGVVALTAASWLADVFVSLLPAGLPWWSQVDVLDLRVLAVAGLGALVIMATVGAGPSLEASRVDLLRVLGLGGSGATDGVRQRRLRDGVVTLQMTLSFVLLVASVLVWRSTGALNRLDLGWNAEGVLRASVAGPALNEESTRWNVMDRISERARSLPTATGAAWSGFPAEVEGVTLSREDRLTAIGSGVSLSALGVQRLAVDPTYFRTSGLELRSGRGFDPGGAAGVVLGETLAHTLWPDGSAVGETLRLGTLSFEVLGVVSDPLEMLGGRDGLRAVRRPHLYLPMHLASPTSLDLRVAAADPAALSGALRELAAEVDPTVTLSGVETGWERALGNQLVVNRFLSSLLGALAAMGILLSSIGLYGLIAYSITLRTREIGIRSALGAEPARIVRTVLRGAVTLLVAALACGGLLAALGSLAVGGFLYGIRLFDPATWLGAASLLGAVTIVAAAHPVRRALAVDPADALRS